MSAIIKKIRLINFKRFRNYVIEPNEKINIFVGDNETGKSTIIDAIDLALNPSINRINAIGIDRLINIDAVSEFNRKKRIFDNLPKMIIEIYLEGDFDHTMNGINNLEKRECDGIRVICEANDDYINEINQILTSEENYFPYDFYIIKFSTFMDAPYSSLRKKIHSVKIDSVNMRSDFATNDFVQRMYMHCTENDIIQRVYHNSKYRIMRDEFKNIALQEINNHLQKNCNYNFGLKNGAHMNLDGDLMIFEDNISIDSKGTGTQVFVKTNFALSRAGDSIDIILLEEPENNLSHTKLRKLIENVYQSNKSQLLITTHNSLISARLELNNLIILHKNNDNAPVMLRNLNIETAKYFLKAPPAGIVEFSLSTKVILVEGPSEFMLLESFYQNCFHRKPEDDDIQVIDVRGLSFKRYLDIAQLTNARIAVITDNDGDYKKNCINKYEEFRNNNNIKIFFEYDNSKNTFEKVLYSDNTELCNSIFTSNAQEFMIKNKTESAYRLLFNTDKLVTPNYIERAIKWIKE